MTHQDFVRNLNNMRAERIKRGWSIHDVADFVDVSERTIKKYEAGIQYPRKHIYRRLAMLFQLEDWDD